MLECMGSESRKDKYVTIKASSEVVDYVADMFYDAVAEERIPLGIPENDDLKVYSFQEFILIVKENENKYLDDYIQWLYPYIQHYANSAIRCHPMEMMDDITTRLNRAAFQALHVYDPSKGDFFHLLSKIMKTALHGTEMDFAQNFHREEKYLGARIRYTNSMEFFDVAVESRQEDIILQVDFEDYLKELTPIEQRMLKLRVYGFGPMEIANLVGIPYTTVFYHLTIIFDGLMKKCRKKK